MKEFEKRYIHFGLLECDNETIGNCRCELIKNEISQDSWHATITAFDGHVKGIRSIIERPKDIKFTSVNDNETIIIVGKFPSISIATYSDEILKYDVSYYSRHRKWNNKKGEKIYLTFYIPQVELYTINITTIMDYKKGLLFGWDESNNKWDDDTENQINKYSLQSIMGTINFSPILLFSETRINDIKAHITLNQMAIECELQNIDDSIQNIQKTIENEIDDYLTILSFIEGDFIGWFYCVGHEQSIEPDLNSELELYKHTAKIKKSKFNSLRYFYYREKLQILHHELTSLYSSKSNEEKSNIKNIIEKFVIASRASTIETKLIYWHSCLDVIIKNFKSNRQPFSVRVVNACKKMGIEWQDLYPEITDESLSKKADFPINTIRNDLLHNGIYPDNYDNAIIDLFKTKALCERFIMKIIGSDYKDTGLGIIEKF